MYYGYAGGLTVLFSETQSERPPDLHFDIAVVDSGNDSATVSIYYTVYDTDLITFKSLNESSRGEYLLGSGMGAESVYSSMELHNHASVYSWVFWLEADSKTDAWSVDVKMTLRYNWSTVRSPVLMVQRYNSEICRSMENYEWWRNYLSLIT